MNALAMKLESTQSSVLVCKEKSKDSPTGKKCKAIRKKSIPVSSDKDALLYNHGLGRKSGDIIVDLNDSKSNISVEINSCKKARSKKFLPKLNDKMVTKSEKMQERLQQFLSPEVKEKISCILNDVRALSDVAKLFLYLQLPTGSPLEVDPFKQKNQNPLGKKADEEGMIAVTWIQSHLEEDPDISLPKQEVYDEYQSYCHVTGTDPLCAADFGKVMKQIFPSVKPRRLGTRGNSRYCYSGLRKKLKLESPSLPDVHVEKENCDVEDENGADEVTAAACHLLFEWAEKLLGIKFTSLKDLATHLLENMYVDNRSVAAFTVLLEASPQLLEKGFANCEGGVKKSEAQIHLQRKIQEKELIKEQKKKLQEQRSNLVVLNKSKGTTPKKKCLKSRKARLSLSSDIPEFSFEKNTENFLVKNHIEDLSTEVLSEDRNSLETHIKEENFELEALSVISTHSPKVAETVIENSSPSKKLSPQSSPGNSINIEDCVKKKNKIITSDNYIVSQNKTPVCIAQSLPGIIIVPSLSQFTEMGKQSTSAPKYKRIQPKPLRSESFSAVVRSRAGSVGSTIINKPKIRNNDGRRSSHAWLQSDCSQDGTDDGFSKSNSVHSNVKIVSLKALPSKSAKKCSLISSKSSTGKCKDIMEDIDSSSSNSQETLSTTSSNEKSGLVISESESVNPEKSDEISKFHNDENSSIKRHLDESNIQTSSKKPHLDITKDTHVCNQYESSWPKDITFVGNTSSTTSVQSSLSQRNAAVREEEVSVHEIEGDALNDYFRGANIDTSVFTSLQQTEQHKDFNIKSRQLSCNNKVKKLSQLRMLLEQNLPRSVPKTVNSLKNQTASTVSALVMPDILTQQVKINELNSKIISTFPESDKTIVSSEFLNVETSCIPPAESGHTIKTNIQIDSIEKLLASSDLTSNVTIAEQNALLSDPSMFLNSTNSDTQQMDVNLQSELSDFNQPSETNETLLSTNVITDAELASNQMHNVLHSGRISTYTQVPSVPQSPNTRRRAFNFMPISPRHTPIPDGSCVPGTPAMSSPVPNQYPRNMMSTAVGPSQPPSNAGSPFVSPRSTPVPFCRSRHSSGQSTYSASRHTPFQNFDSGVSSVSTSPFISPQPTPVPVSRLRHNSSHGSSKTVTFCSINSPQIIHSQSSVNNIGQLRTRHSSGPGGPHLALCSPRSAPLSPLVSEHCPSTFLFPAGNEARSRHNSGSNTTLSPVSEQASSSSSCTSNLPDLSSVSETSSMSHSFLNDGAADLFISANPTTFKQVRQRHASSSVIYSKPSLALKDTFSQEVQKLLKNSQANGTPDLILSNRSQSVPLHQMIQNFDSYCLLTQPLEEPYPKSHPTTPVINQAFSFPVLGSNQEASTLAIATDSNRDKSLVQSSHMEWSGLEGASDLEMSSARRNLTTLLDAPLSDDLQTTLEDLRDCDTDFSKFAQELELSQNEELELSQNE